jgi:hypothetical protein
MDREKIVKQLNDVLLKVRDDINTNLRQPLLHMRDTDWEQVPKLLEDCRYIIDELNKTVAALSETRQSASETFSTMQGMYKEWQKTQALTVPSTLSEHVRAVIDEFVVGQEKFIHVDEVRKKLEAKKVPLYFKNPAAVLASIIARDGRLEGRGMGLFKKKTNKAS